MLFFARKDAWSESNPSPKRARQKGEKKGEREEKEKRREMSGFGDGYVGTAQDAVKIRRLQKQREAEQRKIQELKNKSGGGNSGLLQFGSSTSEVSQRLYLYPHPINLIQPGSVQKSGQFLI